MQSVGANSGGRGVRDDREYDLSMTAVVIELDEATVNGLRDGSGDGGVVRVEVDRRER